MRDLNVRRVAEDSPRFQVIKKLAIQVCLWRDEAAAIAHIPRDELLIDGFEHAAECQEVLGKNGLDLIVPEFGWIESSKGCRSQRIEKWQESSNDPVETSSSKMSSFSPGPIGWIALRCLRYRAVVLGELVKFTGDIEISNVQHDI